MDNNQKQTVFQQARDIKSQSIEGLKQMCENFANVRHTIEQYNQQQNNKLKAGE